MRNFESFGIDLAYKRISKNDRLQWINQGINWERFRPIIANLFYDNKTSGGRPHTDEVVFVKCMVLQAWYGLSDEELEFQIADRISFRNFIGTDRVIPDFTTIWKIRERCIVAGIEEKIWSEVQKQLVEKGLCIKKGVMQDATIIKADLGKKRYMNEKKAEKNNKKIKYTEQQEKHIDRDASFTAKAGNIFFGYKLHTKVDVKNNLIREFEVTTASVHDSNIDLTKEGDQKIYRDRGYTGKILKTKNVKDMTMKKKKQNKPWTKTDIKTNRKIAGIRAAVERPYHVIKNIFNGQKIFVKNIKRVKIKLMFNCIGYNYYYLVTCIKKQRNYQTS